VTCPPLQSTMLLPSTPVMASNTASIFSTAYLSLSEGSMPAFARAPCSLHSLPQNQHAPCWTGTAAKIKTSHQAHIHMH
jgi:hypothetical protein